MRVYRSGGMTKDAIYLRGLVELLEHLGADGSLDQLRLGKFSLRDLPLIGDLEDRGLLRPPRVLPALPARPGDRRQPGPRGRDRGPQHAPGRTRMKIGFVVNDIETEKAEYTTNRLAMAAKEMGHEAWYMGIGDFAYQPDGSLSTKARAGHAKSYRSLERHLADVQKPDVEQLIPMAEFDVVMLRNDPADDAETDPWRNNAGVAFGQLIASSGVLVVNDPTSLANALSKAYFQHFPEIVRPRR